MTHLGLFPSLTGTDAPRSRRHGAVGLPIGVGLAAAAVVSLALWAAIFCALAWVVG
jgi:hypothetical protein